ncbi:DUF4136 domain-containing protein [Sneathiella chinensis]|uniref:DUF4136 domain-containing protein n=1 Tax=Sneathiella chinensis TaxID=349750 RepID=A0ABQ5TZJ2_9PROT|nr:DUF4136 domain-containing protein [Sneathiella chinensis]GLQ04805.1 hypothetical protein GCM10007924_00260 [Sneathiella chinensis]
MSITQKILPLIITGLILTGCASVSSKVTRFNYLPDQQTGGTLYFEPGPEQKGSAEFSHYTESVGMRLETLGFRPAPDRQSADYIAKIRYGVSDAQQIVSSRPVYGYSSLYYGYGYRHHLYPSYGIVGYAPYSETRYDKYFAIRIMDNRTGSPDNPRPVYEAKATSTGRASTFADVAECMIDAVFDDFHTRGTHRVSKNIKDCGPGHPAPN